MTGLEFLEGIPGTIGGALRMNAGAMGGWMFDVVESIRYMDHNGQVHEEIAAKVKVEYRACPLFKNHIALGAVLKAHPASREVVEKRMKTFSEKRWASQPAAPSAGCIFKNPATIPAGKLIDELGLKGESRWRRDGLPRARQFHRQRGQGDGEGRFGPHRGHPAKGPRRTRD